MNATTIGLDIAKSVFQLHGEDAEGRLVVQKRLSRRGMAEFFAKLAPCVVALEACGTSHYWGRTLRAMGHEVRLIPAAYVKPFVRRNKTDARDAAAICGAAAGHAPGRHQERGAAGLAGARAVARASDQAAHATDEQPAGDAGRVRDRGGAGGSRLCRIAGAPCQRRRAAEDAGHGVAPGGGAA